MYNQNGLLNKVFQVFCWEFFSIYSSWRSTYSSLSPLLSLFRSLSLLVIMSLSGLSIKYYCLHLIVCGRVRSFLSWRTVWAVLLLDLTWTSSGIQGWIHLDQCFSLWGYFSLWLQFLCLLDMFKLFLSSKFYFS